MERGEKRLGVSLATGGGKTVIFTQLIERVKPLSKLATQTLVLAHRRELVEQAAKHAANAYPHKSLEIEMGNLHASGTADITIASLQSITSGDRLAKFDPGRFKLVLVDEAHHIVARGYVKILSHLGLTRKSEDSPHLVGVSATFSRFDGLSLGAAFDHIVYHKDYVDMIEEKWLSDVIFTTVKSTANLSGVKSKGTGDFDLKSLSQAVNNHATNDLAVRTWLAKARDRKSSLVFCVDVNHVLGLTQAFRRHNIDARFVTGETPLAERGELLEQFRQGLFPVLLNCNVFTEGTDIPNVDCIMLARPTRSRNLLVQMIGRGMRLHAGKANCHVIDMVSSLETGIVTTPTLFGLDPNELVDSASPSHLRELRAQREKERPPQERGSSGHDSSAVGLTRMQWRVTFTDYDSVFDLISDTSGERHIRAISQNAWVQVAPRRFVLTGPTGTFIRLETPEVRSEDDMSSTVYTAWEVRALPPGVSKSPFAAPRVILQATTFEDAVHGCDKYADEIFPRAFVHRRMRWREGPPTAGQLKFLNGFRMTDKQLTENDITKGAASDLITKLKHGARGQFAKMEANRRRRDRFDTQLEKIRERWQRETASVGPLSSDAQSSQGQ
ncbi:hypothetical protein VTK73DRAFT_8346 [Phialemonium thermophilum]|uniref:Uncharacterized protein n=1 Tax=Phialemonium thermophilum TaxID=223376 RepID=A0ABR3Y687_9PEZI